MVGQRWRDQFYFPCLCEILSSKVSHSSNDQLKAKDHKKKKILISRSRNTHSQGLFMRKNSYHHLIEEGEENRKMS